MKIKGIKITADAGKLLTKDGIYSDCIFLGKNDSVDNWKEVDASEKPLEPNNPSEQPTQEQLQSQYEAKVEELIRLRYTLSEEIALSRQRDTKTQEWQEYYDYCEQCKSGARMELGV